MAAPMKLFMFSSESNEELHAFTKVGTGENLPEKHGPWVEQGVLRADQSPPHGLARSAIESGVKANGFQLWRRKKKASE